ncbi:hypothetical protein PR048_001494 [Dryococelus australis]|uniref:PiggyBac transposable element-derived protein domain-containing protein n=1 Tax=Dryococelus australis TaxID=614101 RepID=A0ABQ9IIJ1_9NEOP|nr:hypothetical protein PR048_001494 [Dryococelus australis]
MATSVASSWRLLISEPMLKHIKLCTESEARDQKSARFVKDKFALVSEVWDTNITVDELLFPTKARCKFTQYMANKPDQFGIKFWLPADVDTKYVLNCFPYLGKDDN